jgi:hypothetical protein
MLEGAVVEDMALLLLLLLLLLLAVDFIKFANNMLLTVVFRHRRYAFC